ncbi:MAG: hypothetical protein AAGB11_09540 [Pseudomonadota bacterium]
MLSFDIVTADTGGASQRVPLFWWQGWSGRYHLTSIYGLRNFACRERGVFVLVRRELDGSRTPLLAGYAESISDDIYDDYGHALLRAIRAGATEIHVNLVTVTPEIGLEMVKDIEQGWNLPRVRPRIYA